MPVPINAPWRLTYKDLQFEQMPIIIHSSQGIKYKRWMDVGMPKISQEALGCVFFLYKTHKDAERGKKSGGTGFFVSIPSEKFPYHDYLYGVTNWHNVLQNGYSIIKLNNEDGGISIIETEPIEWEFIPRKDDIAVIPFGDLYDEKYKITVIQTKLFATESVIRDKGIGIGDNVYMIGRFIDYDGEITNQPALRFGNISIMPVPIKQEATGYMGESYCIDLHSRTGFSGSPIFIYRTPGNNFDEKIIHLDERFQYLLGIHWGQFPEEWEIIMKDKLPKTEKRAFITKGKYVKGLSGMTCVIPAQKILDVLNLPALKKQRAEGDQKLMNHYIETGFPPEAELAMVESIESDNLQHKEDFNSLVSAAAKKKPLDD
jgi:hypothetical protein